MTLNELPQKTQDRLRKEMSELHTKNRNTAYEVLVYNTQGTRFFWAKRNSYASTWNGHFGGGSDWSVKYGKMSFKRYKNPVGEADYELCFGSLFGSKTIGDRSIVIPNKVSRKKDVIDLLNSLEIR